MDDPAGGTTFTEVNDVTGCYARCGLDSITARNRTLVGWAFQGQVFHEGEQIKWPGLLECLFRSAIRRHHISTRV